MVPVIGIETHAHLCYTRHYLTPGICSLIKPTAMKKLMSFPTGIYTVMLWYVTRASQVVCIYKAFEKCSSDTAQPTVSFRISIFVIGTIKIKPLRARGRFKNTYELLNQRALKFSYVNKIHIFQCMGKIFCVEFQRYPLKFHTKYLTHALKDMIFMQFWNFKSS